MDGGSIFRGAIWGEVMISMGITEMMRILPIAGMAWFSFFPSLLINVVKTTSAQAQEYPIVSGQWQASGR